VAAPMRTQQHKRRRAASWATSPRFPSL
jgi:hypothetical protein